MHSSKRIFFDRLLDFSDKQLHRFLAPSLLPLVLSLRPILILVRNFQFLEPGMNAFMLLAKVAVTGEDHPLVVTEAFPLLRNNDEMR